MKTLRIATITVAIAATAMMTQTAQAEHGNGYQTRIRIQPQIVPVPARPALGIMGQATHRNGVHGVLVVRDTLRRPLQQRLPCGNLSTAYFRTGYDVVTNVNGQHIDSSHDITRALNFGYNTLSVYDSYTRSWATVQVYIAGNVAPAPGYPMPVIPQPVYPAIAPAGLQP